MLDCLEVVVEGRRRAAMPTQPQPALISSSPWKGFLLQEHNLPALEMPDHRVLSRLAIEMHSSYSVGPVRLDQYRGGLSELQLRRVLDYVDSFLDHKLTVDELAGLAGLSRYHFGKAFKQSTGITLHRYVLSRRLWRAEELLSNAKSTLVDIAAAVGFANQSHFTTVFKNRIGISPGAYQKHSRMVALS